MEKPTRQAKVHRLLCIKGLVDNHPYPALNDLDRKLIARLNRRDGFFIECGANNGHLQSNTFALEYQYGWRGILIEAIPDLARLCAFLRLGAEVYNCALVAEGFAGETVTMRFAGLKSLVRGCKQAEVEEQWVTSGIRNESLGETYAVEVHARTLNSILDDERPERIDLFSLDVEGYELEVLKGLDLDRHRPEFILVEAHDPAAIGSHLAPWYDLEAELTPGWDFLYRARRPLGA
ncbi:FkbM family methyltransferase [Desulfovibrio aminophilus]|nr:FkbM family methyltransferase [Desulfovibrio aminophilus]MCM0756643.1 FkbM family methyltransferase [Desulfovibrio aminophilus]